MKEKTCKCSGKIRQDMCFLEGFLVECMKCDNCNDVLFTPEQTKELIKLREANAKIEAKRKIVKVGSSIAALLPKKVEELGIQEGLIDKVKVLSSRSLEIRFNKEII